MIGQVLSHYRVTGRLGVGGMGEVYRATDTLLGREVAIKLLPPEVAQDPDRLARLRREAQILSLLNHPNVASIYGIDGVEGRPFLVLELVEGEDLQQRLARGAIPLDEALEIGIQIAEALEEAHQKGIVHRDLKPANVKLTPAVRVKVLDFGLAKSWGGEARDGSISAVEDSPTRTRDATRAGVVLGTAAYMAPEQARSRVVDRRADVWSFGVLLWEMLTGRALFDGETVADVIAAVLTKEPDLGALPPSTPEALRRLIARCLRRDVRRRLPDIGAARLELQEIREGGAAVAADRASATAEVPTALRHPGRPRRLWTASALLAVALGGGLAFVRWAEPRSAVPPFAWFTVGPPAGFSFSTEWFAVAPCPNERQVVFWATGTDASGSRSLLWTRPLDAPAARALAGTEGATSLTFWSPDGRHLGFFTETELRKLSLADGSVQRVCSLPASGPGSGDWSEDGTVLFSTGADKGRIYSVPANGGEARLVVEPDAARGETLVHAPVFLPGGRRFLFLVASPREEVRGVYLASLSDPRKKRRILPAMARVQYTAGHLLFVRDGALLAQPFDARQGQLTDEPITVATDVGAWREVPSWGWFGASRGGVLAYFSRRTAADEAQLTWVDRRGQSLGTVGRPGPYGQIALSPDERHVAVEMSDPQGHTDIWVMELARGVASRVTTRAGDDQDPVWWPDGRSLVFTARDAGKGMLRRKGLRAAEPESALSDFPDEDHAEGLSGDGRGLLFVRRSADDAHSIWILNLPEGLAERLVDSRFRVDEPHLSPDERWLAYVSRESGRDEVYVEPFRRPGERVRVSVDGGGQPKWRRDGQELFFVSTDGELMAVDVRPATDRLQVGLPVALFKAQAIEGTGYDDVAPSGDGRRFLVKVPLGTDAQPRLNVVTHWPSLAR